MSHGKEPQINVKMSNEWWTVGKDSSLKWCAVKWLTPTKTAESTMWVTLRNRLKVQGYLEASRAAENTVLLVPCVLWQQGWLREARAPRNGLQWPHKCFPAPESRVKMVGTHRTSSIWDFLRAWVGLNLKAKLSMSGIEADGSIQSRVTCSLSWLLNGAFSGQFTCISFSRFNRRRNPTLCPVWNKDTFPLFYNTQKHRRTVHHE